MRPWYTERYHNPTVEQGEIAVIVPDKDLPVATTTPYGLSETQQRVIKDLYYELYLGFVLYIPKSIGHFPIVDLIRATCTTDGLSLHSFGPRICSIWSISPMPWRTDVEERPPKAPARPRKVVKGSPTLAAAALIFFSPLLSRK